MAIILASASPRRAELLRMIGINDFKITPDTSAEEISTLLKPEETVLGLATKKANNVSHFCEKGDIIIAADTLVYLNGQPLEKPQCEKNAFHMLSSLSGKAHTVYTAIVVKEIGGKYVSCVDATKVFFRSLSENEIHDYILTGEPMDKAGAYGAQGKGAVFIERIEGDFFTVMGLSICRLSLMLKEFDLK